MKELILKVPVRIVILLIFCTGCGGIATRHIPAYWYVKRIQTESDSTKNYYYVRNDTLIFVTPNYEEIVTCVKKH